MSAPAEAFEPVCERPASAVIRGADLRIRTVFLKPLIDIVDIRAVQLIRKFLKGNISVNSVISDDGSDDAFLLFLVVAPDFLLDVDLVLVEIPPSSLLALLDFSEQAVRFFKQRLRSDGEHSIHLIPSTRAAILSLVSAN